MCSCVARGNCEPYIMCSCIASGNCDVVVVVVLVGLVGCVYPSFYICHTPFREGGNEASIRVPGMFKSHV
jgi:hypothetical protein